MDVFQEEQHHHNYAIEEMINGTADSPLLSYDGIPQEIEHLLSASAGSTHSADETETGPEHVTEPSTTTTVTQVPEMPSAPQQHAEISSILNDVRRYRKDFTRTTTSTTSTQTSTTSSKTNPSVSDSSSNGHTPPKSSKRPVTGLPRVGTTEFIGGPAEALQMFKEQQINQSSGTADSPTTRTTRRASGSTGNSRTTSKSSGPSGQSQKTVGGAVNPLTASVMGNSSIPIRTSLDTLVEEKVKLIHKAYMEQLIQETVTAKYERDLRMLESSRSVAELLIQRNAEIVNKIHDHQTLLEQTFSTYQDQLNPLRQELQKLQHAVQEMRDEIHRLNASGENTITRRLSEKFVSFEHLNNKIQTVETQLEIMGVSVQETRNLSLAYKALETPRDPGASATVNEALVEFREEMHDKLQEIYDRTIETTQESLEDVEGSLRTIRGRLDAVEKRQRCDPDGQAIRKIYSSHGEPSQELKKHL